MKLEVGNRKYILVSHSVTVKVIRSKHGKNILENTKQYDATNGIVKKNWLQKLSQQNNWHLVLQQEHLWEYLLQENNLKYYSFM